MDSRSSPTGGLFEFIILGDSNGYAGSIPRPEPAFGAVTKAGRLAKLSFSLAAKSESLLRTPMINDLKKLIEQSERILITSHIGPDGDAVSSSLLLYQLLRENYPDKLIEVTLEERPYGLDFLQNYESIKFQPLDTALEKAAPDLFVILDANALYRLTRAPESAQKYLETKKPKIIVIDHHEGLEFPDPDVYINNKSPAVALDIYDIFIDKLGYKKPEGYAETALTGIYTDTGGFVHRNMNFQRTFEVVSKLIADGANIESVANHLSLISEGGLKILGELIANTTFESDHIYTYISDKSAHPDNHEAMVQGTDAFRSNFLREVKGRSWGFIVQRDVEAHNDNTYSVSFRAVSGTKDVSEIAARLGGGGHKPAAGAKFSAKNVEDALRKVRAAINGSSAGAVDED